jgi:hypothetical protein
MQDILGFLKVTLSSLDKRYTVLNITLRLIQPPDLAPHFFGNRESGSVITCPVNPLAGAEPFNALCHIGLRYPKAAIGV